MSLHSETLNLPLAYPTCEAIVRDVWWSGYLIIGGDFPKFITFFYWWDGFWRSEIYYIITGIAMTLDWTLNWGLRQAFAIAAPYPECIDDYNTPDFGTEHLTLFLGLAFMAVGIYRQRKLTLLNCFFFAGTFYGFMYCRLWVAAIDARSVFFGAYTALIQILLYKALFDWLLARYPYLDDMPLDSRMHWRDSWLGFKRRSVEAKSNTKRLKETLLM